MSYSILENTISTVIVYANFYQFAAKESVRYPRAESRLFLWCVSGKGWVNVNQEGRHLMVPGDFVFLPWAHAMRYEPDEREPFYVGGIHIIPFHSRRVPVGFSVPHSLSEPFAGCQFRKDIAWPGLESTIHGTLGEERLAWLASYAIDVFHNTARDEQTMRMLGQLMMREIFAAANSGTASVQPMPGALRRILEHVNRHVDKNLTVDELAAMGECSVATVHRFFAQFIGLAPHQFISQRRIREAKRLLRTTLEPVSRVGVAVGFQDPFHFSRFFKRQTGLSPRQYRQRSSIL